MHLRDEDLVRASDGELSAWRAAQVRAHLAECGECQARMGDIERASADVIRHRQAELDPRLPPASGRRALLKAHLAEAAASQGRAIRLWSPAAAWQIAAAAVFAAAAFLATNHSRAMPRPAPDPRLTPGAVVPVTRGDICAAPGAAARVIPASLQRKVFEEYGMANAQPRAYEVDYLITPELGGSDDIQNLWPQPYSSTAWNARVKDELEDRLHELVCAGQIDLATAQRDISSDWISAYKKYFRSDRPLARR